MKRVLWCVLPERGHYNPMLGPAAMLEERGVEVTFYAPRAIRDALAAAGVTRFVTTATHEPPPASNRGAEFAALLADPQRLSGWIERMLVDSAEADIEPLRAVIREVRPQVVVLDAMAYAAAIAAHCEGLPWVCVSSSLNPIVPDDVDTALIRTTHALNAKRCALFARYGIDARFRVSDVLSPYGTVVLTTEAFAGPPPEGVVLAGPALPLRSRGEPAIDLEFVGQRPLIYASFGTQAFHQPRWFANLFEAVRHRDVALLASTGDLRWDALPENVRTVPFAPQLDVLRRASVFVTHGGANSVMESLALGVPLLVSPICNDQHHNAILVERAGVGRTISLDDVPEALTAPPADPRVMASYRDALGAAATADVIEKVLA